MIYPQTCRECGCLITPKEIFCLKCISNIKPIVARFLPINKTHSLKVFAASIYQKPVKSLVLKKFYKDPLASKQLGQMIMQFTPIKKENIDVIVPIPLHWTRYAKRGYNQATIIAKEIGQSTDKPVIKLLRRRKKTKFQSMLAPQDRQDNVYEAFCLHWFYKKRYRDLIEDKTILLVDDLCTTGVTLQSAAKILMKYKPKSVIAVVACRAL